MRFLISTLLVLLFTSYGYAQTVTLSPAYPNLTFAQPVFMLPYPGTNSAVVVGELGGIIHLVRGNGAAATKETFLDLTTLVGSGGERGLLSLVFDPKFRSNGYFYLHYSGNGDGRTVISRFRVKDGVASLNSRRVIFQLSQPFSNHNGGSILFGKDNYLYIALGDGGSSGDPFNNAQKLNKLLGKILRIDVSRGSNGKRYSIPRSNPFRTRRGARPEIYAYGLRNPWRMNFDSKTGKLWCGDVGQGAYEEIDLIERGKNYGWRIREGKHCYNPSQNCRSSGLTPPIFEYNHDSGSSITGGYVYRGKAIPSLVGRYIYGDFVSGNIWSLTKSGTRYRAKKLIDTEYLISSFGIDKAGELYLLDYQSGGIYKIEKGQ